MCSIILDRNDLLVQNIRGQGYDGASNMRGARSGLQALFLQECPYAYYVHCFAHRLEFALVAASGERTDIDLFFQMLNSIINVVRASPKRNQSLRLPQRNEIKILIEEGDLKTGKGANRRTTLQRSASTRCSPHYSSACSLLDLYNLASKVLYIIQNDSLKGRMRSEASGAFKAMKKFKKDFILYLIIEVMRITNVLCEALQKNNQDALSGMDGIAITKTLLCDLKKDDKWKKILQIVVTFSTTHDIIIQDMNALNMKGTLRSCQQRDTITVENYYRFDILHETVDTQVMELTERFFDNTIELLKLISVLDPRNSFKSLNIDDLCVLVKKYYPEDFIEMQKNHELLHQLQHYERDMSIDPDFKNIYTLSQLCPTLV